MQHVALTAKLRPEHLTKSARNALRASGRILASVYGKGRPSKSVTLSAAELARVLSADTGANTLVDLSIESSDQRHLVRLTAIDIEPLTSRFRHVGLHVIAATEKQKSSVPIELVGEPEAVHNHIALLEPGVATVEIQAMPEDLVGHLTLDVSGMRIGEVIHASDLPLPPRVELLSDPALPVASVRLSRDTMSASDRELSADDESLSGVARDSSSVEESLLDV